MKVISPPLRLTNVYHPAYRQDAVFTKEFDHPHCSLSLRPFCVLTDLTAIYSREPAETLSGDLIAASYMYTRESSFASSYMVLVDQHLPVCEVDICRAMQDEICDYFKAEPGDHIIRLLPASPRRIRQRFFTCMLQACIEYFLTIPEIKRLFIESDTENAWQHELLLKSGFRLREKICQEYKDTNLYHFSPRRRVHN